MNWDLINCEWDMLDSARQAGLSIIKTAHLLGLFHTAREWCEKENLFSEQQFSVRKCPDDVKGQWRMARLLGANKKATVTQITIHQTQGMHKSISAQH